MHGSLRHIIVAAFALAAFAPTGSRAALSLTDSVDNTGTDNVFFDQAQTGNPVNGQVEQNSNVFAVFSTTQSEGLNGDGSAGQARVEILGTTNQDPIRMTNISVSLAGGAMFDKIVFNPFGDGIGPDIGVAKLTVFTNDGLSGTTFVPPNFVTDGGNNFYTLVASAGTHITKITIDIDTTGGKTGFVDLRQVRIGGISTVTAVPEPSTVAMAVAGLPLIGVAALRRKRRNQA